MKISSILACRAVNASEHIFSFQNARKVHRILFLSRFRGIITLQYLYLAVNIIDKIIIAT